VVCVPSKFSAWSTGSPCVPCAGRLSCAPLHARRGSRSPPCAAVCGSARRIRSRRGSRPGGSRRPGRRYHRR